MTPKRSVNFVQKHANGSGTLFIAIDGGDTNLPIGEVCTIEFGGHGKITKWEVTSDRFCSAIFDIEKRVKSEVNQLRSIISTHAPCLLFAKDATCSELKSWDSRIEPGDEIRVDLVAASNVRRINLQLMIKGTRASANPRLQN